MSIKIKVISPEKTIWDTEAEQIILPSITGGIGVLTNHAPLITVLTSGLLKKREQDGWTPLIIRGGIAQIEDNEITVLANAVEEFSKTTMGREEADKKVLDLLQEVETLRQVESTENTNKLNELNLEVQVARARVEGLTLIES